MNHAHEGMLQAYLDGEVTGAARQQLAEHVASCAACAAELDALRTLGAQVGTALNALDRPLAVHGALRAVRERASALPAAPAERRISGSFVRAAILTLLAAGGVSAAIPGSPVRDWLAGAWDRVAGVFETDRIEPVAEEPVVAAAEESGLTIAPYQGRVTVSLTDVDAAVSIRVVLVDQAAASVTAASTGARFGTARGRIEVADVGSRDIVVRLPLSAHAAVVEVNGQLYASKTGDALMAHVAPRRLTQHELVFETQD